MADSIWVHGTVKAANDKGFTLGEKGPDGKDQWFNYSLPEYRDAAFFIPAKGNAIQALISGGKFAKSIIPMNGAPQQYNAPVEGPQMQGGTEWPPDEVYSEPGGIPVRDVNADVAWRSKTTDESIQMQVAVKCATELMIALIEHGREDSGKTMAPTSIAAEVAAMANAIAVVYSE